MQDAHRRFREFRRGNTHERVFTHPTCHPAEATGFCFAGDASALALNIGRFNTHNEGPYLRTALRDIKPASIINLPFLVEMPGGGCAAILTPAKNESTAPNKGSRHS